MWKAALRAYEAQSEALLRNVAALNVDRLTPSDRAVVASMREELESAAQMRVCRRELWAISHMGGWHLQLSTIAREQPVSSADERAQALERWSALPTRVVRILGPEIRAPLYALTGGMRERYLLPTARGERESCFAQTEPDAGSDPGAMRTTAVRDGDHFVINGVKRFITGADRADFVILMAATVAYIVF